LFLALAEANNGLEIDLVNEVKDNLESSLIILGVLAVFLESDNNLDLAVSARRVPVAMNGGSHTLADSAPGNLTAVYKFFLNIVSHVL
jgi:predicted cation transporter